MYMKRISLLLKEKIKKKYTRMYNVEYDGKAT